MYLGNNQKKKIFPRLFKVPWNNNSDNYVLVQIESFLLKGLLQNKMDHSVQHSI